MYNHVIQSFNQLLYLNTIKIQLYTDTYYLGVSWDELPKISEFFEQATIAWVIQITTNYPVTPRFSELTRSPLDHCGVCCMVRQVKNFRKFVVWPMFWFEKCMISTVLLCSKHGTWEAVFFESSCLAHLPHQLVVKLSKRTWLWNLPQPSAIVNHQDDHMIYLVVGSTQSPKTCGLKWESSPKWGLQILPPPKKNAWNLKPTPRERDESVWDDLPKHKSQVSPNNSDWWNMFFHQSVC